MARTVLVVGTTALQDDGVPLVRSALAARGARVVWVDSTRMPLEVDLSWGDDAAAGFLRTPSDAVALDEVDAVWLRHTHIAAGVWDLLDPAYAEAIKTQTVTGLWDVLGTLDGCLHVDRIQALQGVPGSVGMLRLAARRGLAVPRTLASNDVDRVAAFLDTCERGAICKMLDSSANKVPMPGGPGYVPTRRVTAEDRARLDQVALCPMVFQEDVPKAVELRITVVGDRLFTGAVDPNGSTKGETDWRQDPALVSAFQPWELDPAVAGQVRGLMTDLGLEFGTVDLIVRPDGAHVFLEVNTISFFDFLEEATGLPISEAIADLLVGHAPPRLPG
jgi:glutathione synthase/RimK-type ligase-like ATP-grasp enzyme